MHLDDLFTYGFTPLMLLIPLVITLIIKTRPDGNVDIYRTWRGWLVLATLACIALHLVVAIVLEKPKTPSWALFFALWFGLAMRAITAKNPAWGNAHPPERTTRTATLLRRDRESPSPKWALWIAWGVWGAALLAIVLRPLRPMPEGHGLRVGLVAALQLLACIWGPLLIPFAARKIAEEPEPLDTEGSAALREAYSKHRRAKANGLAGLQVAMTVLTSAALVLVAWIQVDGLAARRLGLYAGILGSLVGVAGGVFGTWMSFQRARIAGILRDIEAQPAESESG